MKRIPNHKLTKKARERESWYISPANIRSMRRGESIIVGPCRPSAITAIAKKHGIKVTQTQVIVVEPKTLKTRKMFIVRLVE